MLVLHPASWTYRLSPSLCIRTFAYHHLPSRWSHPSVWCWQWWPPLPPQQLYQTSLKITTWRKYLLLRTLPTTVYKYNLHKYIDVHQKANSCFKNDLHSFPDDLYQLLNEASSSLQRFFWPDTTTNCAYEHLDNNILQLPVPPPPMLILQYIWFTPPAVAEYKTMDSLDLI